MDGYSAPFRFERNGNGGSILLYNREDIPSKLLSMKKNIDGFFVEKNLRDKKKWLLNCSYSPTKTQISNHLAELSKSTDFYLIKYDQFLFLGDINARVEDSSVKDTRREKVPSNKTPRPTKSMNESIWVVGTCNQLFRRGYFSETKLSRK